MAWTSTSTARTGRHTAPGGWCRWNSRCQSCCPPCPRACCAAPVNSPTMSCSGWPRRRNRVAHRSRAVGSGLRAWPPGAADRCGTAGGGPRRRRRGEKGGGRDLVGLCGNGELPAHHRRGWGRRGSRRGHYRRRVLGAPTVDRPARPTCGHNPSRWEAPVASEPRPYSERWHCCVFSPKTVDLGSRRRFNFTIYARARRRTSASSAATRSMK